MIMLFVKAFLFTGCFILATAHFNSITNLTDRGLKIARRFGFGLILASLIANYVLNTVQL